MSFNILLPQILVRNEKFMKAHLEKGQNDELLGNNPTLEIHKKPSGL